MCEVKIGLIFEWAVTGRWDTPSMQIEPIGRSTLCFNLSSCYPATHSDKTESGVPALPLSISIRHRWALLPAFAFYTSSQFEVAPEPVLPPFLQKRQAQCYSVALSKREEYKLRFTSLITYSCFITRTHTPVQMWRCFSLPRRSLPESQLALIHFPLKI